MTDKNKPTTKSRPSLQSALSSFHLEADRGARGMSIILSGIIGISDFSDTFIHLLSHGGRIAVNGSRLFINVYENHNLEIVGKVEGIIFTYGKN